MAEAEAHVRSVSPSPDAPTGESFRAKALSGSPEPEADVAHLSAFPPIASYAFVSNCEVSGLIAPDGSVEWLCLPRHDGPSIFTALLDRDAGAFRMGPASTSVPLSRQYVPGTMVVETVWQTPTGWLVVRDALLLARWYNIDKRSAEFRRSPLDFQADPVLLRTAECIYGQVELHLSCLPKFDYGRVPANWSYTGSGYNLLSAQPESGQPRPILTLASNMRCGIEANQAEARTVLNAGDKAFAALGWSAERPPPQTQEEAESRMDETVAFWRRWLDAGRVPDHRWRPYIERSALTLKGLTYMPTGALLAAGTTSLPETPGGNRNYDYRFSWLRDSVLMLLGLSELGFQTEARDFASFIRETARPQQGLQIMYGIGSERDLEERVLEHLRGYENSAPVRIGNAAYNQRQHDVWGNLMALFFILMRQEKKVPEFLWRGVVRVMDDMGHHWKEPDRGLWEVRGEPKHFTSSKVQCWVAARCAAVFAGMRGEQELHRKWTALAEEIKVDVCTHGVDERGVFTQSYGSKALDASNLLLVLFGFLPPDDPRIRATVLAIADELTEDDLVLRYRTDETDDGFSGKEGSFTICTFWLVSSLVAIGETARARKLCEKVLALASPLGLYAEELDPKTGRHLGNFPQAFTHLSLIDAVTHVIKAEERERVQRLGGGIGRQEHVLH